MTLLVSISSLRVRFGLAMAILCSASQTIAQQPAGNGTTPAATPSPELSAQISNPRPGDESAALVAQLADAAGEDLIRSNAAATHDDGPAGIVPYTRGFNASLGTSGQHDSSDGWSSILTPNLAYRFGPHFSVNGGLAVYDYINVVRTTDTKNAKGVVTKTTSALATQHFLLGDTIIEGGFDAHPHLFDYNLTGTLGIPTGDDSDGLGAGQFTYAFNNHFEHPIGDYLTPDLELGFGDNSTLDDVRVRKSYVAVGPNAHFQVGLGVSLPFNANFESDAYEDLPVGTQTVTSTTTNGKKGKQAKTITTTSQESIGEDNGFLNTLDIPLNGHITLSGFYNRSLRNKIDTAGFSLTFLLRAAPREHTDSH